MTDEAGSIAVVFTALGYTIGGIGQCVLKGGSCGRYFVSPVGRPDERDLIVRFESPEAAKDFDQAAHGIKQKLVPVTVTFDPV